jgi:UDP-N-acetylmuramoyl-L-alanyl-D-glutamate--2,6-diaminopimelate ligase
LLRGDIGGVDAGGEFGSVSIAGLTADSRQVEPGFLFAALPGRQADGGRFIADAVRRGAVAILASPAAEAAWPDMNGAGHAVARLVDNNPRRRFALLAARFYGRQPEIVAAATGTNGKTSVTWFLRQIWQTLGHPAANLGTLGMTAPGLSVPGSLTTPDPVALHAVLAQLAAAGVSHLAMEASSHGLDQFRLDGVRIDAAAFTNLTRDHLDYHGSEAAYLAAKLRLFREVTRSGGTAVVNADAAHAGDVIAAAAGRLSVLSFGERGRDLQLLARDPVADGQRLTVACFGAKRTVLLPLSGDFQASNALCAVGLAVATGADPEAALAALAALGPVPGRLERAARRANGASVYVDYAHSPDALAAVLGALRPYCRGRLTVVFGCGGDRDAGKRPLMGRTAADLADRVIVTDDNPRGETPAAIRRAILAGCPQGLEIGDREEAIRWAVRDLAAGDVLVVAGKGHETGQIVGNRVMPFDDAEIVRRVVREVDA